MDLNNLLTDPLLSVESPDGLANLDLPGLLGTLGQDQPLSLPGLQPHQEDAFHVFLCYLAGAVLARQGADNPTQTVDSWREGIRSLTPVGDDDCAWRLLVTDPTQPAFMQPPVVSKKEFAGFRLKGDTPDALDVLQTAKNHDVKMARTGDEEPEDWVYALVSLQTMSGYLGGNYGIARMNGGFASRPVVGLVPAGGWARRFRRDVRCLLALRATLIAGPWRYRADGLVITWTAPWDRKTALPLGSLDPFFIEVSRAVRLVETDGRIAAFGASSSTARIAARETKGVLGDPWIPLNQKGKEPTALTVGPAGLSAQLLRDLLFEEGYQPAAMQHPIRGEEAETVMFSASVLVRGQGTTDGFHKVEIPIPDRVRTVLFRRGAERDGLARRSKRALDEAGQLQNRVLKPAVLSLLQGGAATRDIDWDKREVGAWWKTTSQAYSTSWSTDFFPWLWQSLDQTDDEVAHRAWLGMLRASAQVALVAAIERYPRKQGRRYRARAVAEGMFTGLLYHNFPQMEEGTAHGTVGN